MSERAIDTFSIQNLGRECEIVTAGIHPIFGSHTPDAYTAYSVVKFGRSLPLVVGPESRSGAIFGIDPSVIARSYQSIIHKQMNMGHQLVVLGSKEDRICGCVLAAAFPEEPEGGWVVGDSIEDAPCITAFAALHKQAKGVDKMVGQHLTGKVKMAVSMEFTFYRDQVGVYDPKTKTTYDRKDIPKELWSFLAEDQDGRLLLKKGGTRNPAPILAIGGKSGYIWFSGVGYTSRPAEKTAEVESIAAEMRDGLMVCESSAVIEFAPGMPVTWPAGQYGRGVVRAVHLDGKQTRNGKTMVATCDSPVLDIELPNRTMILRSAGSVRKKFSN